MDTKFEPLAVKRERVRESSTEILHSVAQVKTNESD